MSRKPTRARRGSDAAASLKQLAYPKAIRIRRPPEYLDQLEHLEGVLHALEAEKVPQAAPAGAEDVEILKIVALAGVGLWRIRQKLVRPGTEDPIDGAQKAFRHVQALWDGLSEAGVKIHDHTGEVLPGGGAYPLGILGSQPAPGVTREVVLETIKPTVYYRDRMVQMGEVIVATPESSEPGTPD